MLGPDEIDTWGQPPDTGNAVSTPVAMPPSVAIPSPVVIPPAWGSGPIVQGPFTLPTTSGNTAGLGPQQTMYHPMHPIDLAGPQIQAPGNQSRQYPPSGSPQQLADAYYSALYNPASAGYDQAVLDAEQAAMAVPTPATVSTATTNASSTGIVSEVEGWISANPLLSLGIAAAVLYMIFGSHHHRR